MVSDAVLNNDWHVVARSQDLQEGKILKARLLGEDLVLWRSSGEAKAWQDRCPHRGSSFATGWVKEDNLVCPYHGFMFNNSGQCVHVPAHPDQPPPARSKACVKTFHVQERYGVVWVCLGTPQQDVPSWPEWDDPSYRHRFFFGYGHCKSSAPRNLENFIDVNHIAYVHGDTLGTPDFAEMGNYKIESKPDGIKVSEIKVWQYDVDMSGEGEVMSASLDILRPLTVCLRRGTPNDCMVILFTVTPVDEEECIGWKLILFNTPGEVPEAEMNELSNKVIKQDITAVESQRPKRLPLDLQAEFHLPSDRTTIAYRKWLSKLGVTFGTIPVAKNAVSSR
ncbi:aromatic ring-hydroxylating dioxygenase subunit alpha [Nostoc sp.]|uniref:aromatic ring-hydroxylating dioxygenase subunit alpha n=1 Tax=Nostoc sp. TaxID=1180 RepID=UPI002FF6060D